ncbi:MAG: adenosylhomocysteine nucleosidase [Rhodobacteraceae bacterium HLUCCA12]|nr:MAG: adenosylhomocysteine nucleosidase [Rhodobacteraceae bacterium HLUCCA12]
MHGPQAPLESIANRRILFVMAAEAEYGPHLRARFRPLITGIGPVEAGVGVASALAGLTARAAPPDLVVSLGSAGSARLDHCAVYQAERVAYRDMDATALGFVRGQTPFLDLPPVVTLPHRIAGLAQASLSTGANIVSGAAYAAIDEDMVDMETYAVLRACQALNTPLVALRGISDGRAALNQVADWTEYLHVIDEKLAVAVDRLGEAIESGLLS